MEVLMDSVARMIEEEDLTTYLELVQSEVNDSDYTSMDIAAALLKMCAGA